MFKIDDKIITYFKILLILPVMMALAQLPGYIQWIIIIGAIAIFVYPKIRQRKK